MQGVQTLRLLKIKKRFINNLSWSFKVILYSYLILKKMNERITDI